MRDEGGRIRERSQAPAFLLFFAGRSFQGAAQSLCGLVAVETAGGDIEHQFLPLFAIRCRLDPINPQENDGGHHGGALVPIEKRMIAAEIKKICGGDFPDVREG